MLQMELEPVKAYTAGIKLLTKLYITYNSVNVSIFKIYFIHFKT